jgi:hypothetical protein
MITETKKAFAIAALIATTGVAAVEMTRNPAQADPMLVMGGAAGYAAERIDSAFHAVAEMPPVAPISVPMALKGDLMPIGCAGPFKADVAAECLDTAYEVSSDDGSMVVETRVGDSTSILVRMMGYTMAVFENETLRSE